VWDDEIPAGLSNQVAKLAKELAIPAERIERAILLIRGQKVILDSDLANLYGVPTKRLNEQFGVISHDFPPISCSN